MIYVGNRDKVCWLYWIHRKTHTDIFTEGYVGVSTNVESRFSAHKSALRGKSCVYRSEFRKAMEEDDLIFNVVLKSSVGYCLELESLLRPAWAVGWNISPGGGSNISRPKHGLYRTKEYGVFKTICTRVKEGGMSLSPEWAGDDGAINFCAFYSKNAVEGKQMFLPQSGVVGESTVIFKTRKDYVPECMKTLVLDGAAYSVSELADMYGMKPNTLSTRLSRGMDLKVALKLQEKAGRLVEVDGRSFAYDGKLTDEYFTTFVSLYESGVSTVEIGNRVGMTSGAVSRLGRKLCLVRPSGTYTDFLGDICKIGPTSLLTQEEYEVIKSMLLSGSSNVSISRVIGVTTSSTCSAIQRLKWKEYCYGEDAPR